MVCCLLAARHFCERPRIGCDGFGSGLAMDESPFPAGGDKPGFPQNLEMVRDSCGGHAAHRDDLATVHVVGCRNSLKDPEASLVGQRFRYFLNLGMVHGPISSVAKALLQGQNLTPSAPNFRKPVSEYFDICINLELFQADRSQRPVA